MFIGAGFLIFNVLAMLGIGYYLDQKQSKVEDSNWFTVGYAIHVARTAFGSITGGAPRTEDWPYKVIFKTNDKDGRKIEFASERSGKSNFDFAKGSNNYLSFATPWLEKTITTQQLIDRYPGFRVVGAVGFKEPSLKLEKANKDDKEETKLIEQLKGKNNLDF